MPTNYNVITAFIANELRAATLRAQQALVEIKSEKPSQAREHIVKARLCFMVALVLLPHGQAGDDMARADADRLDDVLREIERLLEQGSSSQND